MEICIIGETNKPRDVIENKIRAMGGKITRNVHDYLGVIISNAKEVSRGYDDDIRGAKIRGIQVVPENFLDQVMSCDDPIQLIVQMDMSERGKDVCTLEAVVHFADPFLFIVCIFEV